MSPVDPILELCRDPRWMRDLAEAGGQTPCYRCLAYRPGTKTGCHFLEVEATETKPRQHGDRPDKQTTLWGND